MFRIGSRLHQGKSLRIIWRWIRFGTYLGERGRKHRGHHILPRPEPSAFCHPESFPRTSLHNTDELLHLPMWYLLLGKHQRMTCLKLSNSYAWIWPQWCYLVEHSLRVQICELCLNWTGLWEILRLQLSGMACWIGILQHQYCLLGP